MEVKENQKKNLSIPRKNRTIQLLKYEKLFEMFFQSTCHWDQRSKRKRCETPVTNQRNLFRASRSTSLVQNLHLEMVDWPGLVFSAAFQNLQRNGKFIRGTSVFWFLVNLMQISHHEHFIARTNWLLTVMQVKRIEGNRSCCYLYCLLIQISGCCNLFIVWIGVWWYRTWRWRDSSQSFSSDTLQGISSEWSGDTTELVYKQKSRVLIGWNSSTACRIETVGLRVGQLRVGFFHLCKRSQKLYPFSLLCLPLFLRHFQPLHLCSAYRNHTNLRRRPVQQQRLAAVIISTRHLRQINAVGHFLRGIQLQQQYVSTNKNNNQKVVKEQALCRGTNCYLKISLISLKVSAICTVH